MVGENGVQVLELTGPFDRPSSKTLPVRWNEASSPPLLEDVAIASLSGDGFPDFVAVGSAGVRSFVQSSPGVFDHNDNGTWLAGTPLEAVAVGRINSDSLADIVAVGETGGWVILQGGGGTFADPQKVVDGSLKDVVIRDFSGDGRFDLAVAGTIGGSSGVHVLRQSASAFAFARNPSTPIVTGSVEAIVVGRLDAGPTADIAASRPNNDDVVIRLGNGTGAFVPGPSRVSPGRRPGALAVGDLDRNGTPDLVVARLDPTAGDADDDVRNTASVMSGAGTGAFSETWAIPVYDAGQDQMRNDLQSIALADIDLDEHQRPDLLFADSTLAAAIMARNMSITPPNPPDPDPPDPTDPRVPDDRPNPPDPRGPTDDPGPRVTTIGSAGPGLAVSAARRQRLSGRTIIALSARCATACSLTARGKLSLRPGAKKKIALGTVRRELRAGEPTSIRFRIPPRRRPAIKRALDRGLRVRATIVITAEDARGTPAARIVVFRLVA